MTLTPEQEMILNDISNEVADMVLRGMTDVKEMAVIIACKYFNGDESDEMVKLIGDEIMTTKLSILN